MAKFKIKVNTSQAVDLQNRLRKAGYAYAGNPPDKHDIKYLYVYPRDKKITWGDNKAEYRAESAQPLTYPEALTEIDNMEVNKDSLQQLKDIEDGKAPAPFQMMCTYIQARQVAIDLHAKGLGGLLAASSSSNMAGAEVHVVYTKPGELGVYVRDSEHDPSHPSLRFLSYDEYVTDFICTPEPAWTPVEGEIVAVLGDRDDDEKRYMHYLFRDNIGRHWGFDPWSSTTKATVMDLIEKTQAPIHIPTDKDAVGRPEAQAYNFRTKKWETITLLAVLGTRSFLSIDGDITIKWEQCFLTDK